MGGGLREIQKDSDSPQGQASVIAFTLAAELEAGIARPHRACGGDRGVDPRLSQKTVEAALPWLADGPGKKK
jgi:hypothetical protein